MGISLAESAVALYIKGDKADRGLWGGGDGDRSSCGGWANYRGASEGGRRVKSGVWASWRAPGAGDWAIRQYAESERGRAAAYRPCFGAGLQPTGPALLALLFGRASGEHDRRGPPSKSPGFPASMQLQAVQRRGGRGKGIWAPPPELRVMLA